MCGIVGMLGFKAPVDVQEFKEMRDSLSHRGPDDAGLWINKEQNIALGHRRLSFLDLSESGRQPMSNEDETLWLTFNGEIYNYLELRKILQAKGHSFKSGTDSEVIIHGYEEWGAGVLQKLKGMFAFGLYDSNKRELMLARDRFGIKPLYYYHGVEGMAFASELKALLKCKRIPREVDHSSLWDFFAYRYVPSPKSIWKYIYKVPPAHYLMLYRNRDAEVKSYWDLDMKAKKGLSEKQAIEEIDQLLLNSVEQHIRSDVEVGSFLSGGYDSSAMVYYLHRLKYPTQTFAIGFEGWERSEHLFAEMVAQKFQTQHHNRIVERGSLDLVEQLVYHYDEPIADISIIPTYLISQEAAGTVKTVLSGEGADEMFGGYTWQSSWMEKWGALGSWDRFKEKQGWSAYPLAVEHYGEAMSMGRFQNTKLRKLFNPDLAPRKDMDSDWWYRSLYNRKMSPLKSIQYMDVKAFMGELVLTKVDRASMAHGLEVRVPFLDHELYERFFQLQESQYFKAGKTKHLLQEIIAPHMPPEILKRKKQGFVGPDSYYQETDFYAEIIRNGKLLKEGILQKDYVESLIEKEDHWRLWKIMVMTYWWEMWV